MTSGVGTVESGVPTRGMVFAIPGRPQERVAIIRCFPLLRPGVSVDCLAVTNLGGVEDGPGTLPGRGPRRVPLVGECLTLVQGQLPIVCGTLSIVRRELRALAVLGCVARGQRRSSRSPILSLNTRGACVRGRSEGRRGLDRPRHSVQRVRDLVAPAGDLIPVAKVTLACVDDLADKSFTDIQRARSSRPANT